MNALTQSLHHPAIAAAVLFGSKARGDADDQSDTDVAVFARVASTQELADVKADLVHRVDRQGVAISLYSTKKAEALAREGSLFLWHLNLEGKVLLDRRGWIYNLFRRLCPYSREKALRDIKTFEDVLRDVGEALESPGDTLLFEAATLFSVLRNLGMIYAHAVGSPCFGRLAPVLRLAEGVGKDFGLTNRDIAMLERARLAYTRAFADIPEGITRDWSQEVVSKIMVVLSFVREAQHETTP